LNSNTAVLFGLSIK